MSKSFTLIDVAKLADVSPSTASRVLRAGDGEKIPFSEETIKRVKEAAELLGYMPSRLARSLVSPKTGVIGMVVPGIGDSFAQDMIEGAQRELISKKYTLLLGNSMSSPDVEKTNIAELQSWRVDGLIILPTQESNDSSVFWDLWNRGYPFVLVDRTFINTPFYTVTSDDYSGAQMAIQYLISKGHKRIAFAARSTLVWTNRFRRKAYITTLLEHGIKPDPSLLVEIAPVIDGGREAIRRLFSLPNPPDALFCCADVVAAGAMDECVRLGIRVPNDLAIVGYSDLDYSGLLRVPLTTVHQPSRIMGEMAVKVLMDLLDGRKPDNVNTMVPVHLVVRESA